MNEIREIFRKFGPQVLHIIIVPAFFLCFMLIYTPFDLDNYLVSPKHGYAFHITILTCIYFGCEIITRSIMFAVRRKLNTNLYVALCFMDVLVAAFFTALYLWLNKRMTVPYFNIVANSFVSLALTSAYPYIVIYLALVAYHRKKKFELAAEAPDDRIRFYDSRKNLKLVLTVSSIYYIGADENYVNIHYQEDGGKTKVYDLRASMKSIEDLCAKNSLVRCHRSYFVNPTHIKTLRKDSDGLVYADIDTPQTTSVPVTKRYYANVSEML